MRGAGHGLQFTVIAGSLRLVHDLQRDRRAERHARLYAGEYPHAVLLVARGGQRALTRPAPCELGLDVGLGKGETGWTAVDNRAHGRSVRFPERRCPEYRSECAAHRFRLSPR